MKYIIKFVSADGLVRYEDREGNIRPNTYLERKALIVEEVRAMRPAEMPTSSRFMRRIYKLRDHGIHPETGQYIFHYEEQI